MLDDGAHQQVVRDDHTVVAETDAEDAVHGVARERRGIPRVEPAVEDVGGHHAVGQAEGDQRAIRGQLLAGVGRVRHVGEAGMGVLEARAVTGEMLERRQDAGLVHALDEGPRVRGHSLGIGGEAAAEHDDGGIEGVHGDVDHGRQVPVDPRPAQRGAQASRLELGVGEIAGPAQLACRGRGQVAEARGKARHQAALVVRGDEQGSAGAAAGQGLEIGGEPAHLLGADHVARLAGGEVPLVEDDAADLDLADEPPHLVVALDLGARKADEEELGDGERRSPALGKRGAAVETQEREEDQRGKARPHQPRAASTSRLTRPGSTGLPRIPSRFTAVPTMRPSAIERSAAAVSGVAPLPTRSGTCGTAPRTRLRSFIGVGSPVAAPETTSPSARPRDTQSRASCSRGIGARGMPCLACTSARMLMSSPRSRR